MTFQAGGSVDDVADHGHPIGLRFELNQRLPGGDGGPDCEYQFGLVGVELLDRFLDSQGGSNCSLWIVLMSSRKSEHGKDSIAQQFLDVTAEALDVFSTPAVIGSQPDANVFRIGTGSVGGEVDQICEQHRDDSSFLACS
jgi:hypothetical protein